THPGHKPYLIVAPVSLIENWQNEYCKFFKNPMSVTILSSAQVPRIFDRKIIDKMQSCELIITNYETVRNCQLNFCAVNFDIVALDEAQKVKTPGTLVTNAVKALKSTFRVAMTGTPVENTLLDLWCIMDFCVPGLLGNAKEFAKKYQHPLKNEETDLIALGNEIHERLGVYFMRRLKVDAAKDLPIKYEIKQPINMPQFQANAYRYVVSSYDPTVKGNMLVTIMGMREVSEHPYLHTNSLASYSTNELIDNAARLIGTMSILDKIRSCSEKAIIFAERKETQKMLQRVVRERYGYTAKIINGDMSTTSADGKFSRQGAIDDFQRLPGFGVIIMSPVAAGMGLNVTSANHVIHYSLHWNPAKENQATDRAYRIGQEKDVYIYYPMAVSPDFKSFDETLDELLSRKTNLASSTIFPTERIE
ncbi:MAG: DEAD/DEAH box helicase, partial [Allobaculum sp.]|nr:DEAD/DEAH box helicase [Allobaculum sp.]